MGLEQLYISNIIRSLSKEEKLEIARTITDEFISSMSPQDRKEMVKMFLPDIIDRLMTDMPFHDRKELVEAVVPIMIAQISVQKEASSVKKEPKSR